MKSRAKNSKSKKPSVSRNSGKSRRTLLENPQMAMVKSKSLRRGTTAAYRRDDNTADGIAPKLSPGLSPNRKRNAAAHSRVQGRKKAPSEMNVRRKGGTAARGTAR